MPTSTITGTIIDGAGTPVAGVAVYARLRPYNGARLSDGSTVANPPAATTNSSGVYLFVLEQQANIAPAGSWWEIEEDTSDLAGGRSVKTINVGSSPATVGQSEVTPLALLGPSALTQAQADLRYEAKGATVFVNAKTDFGAKGDGVTDDTAALAAALASVSATGGIVYLPAGTYIVSATLQIPSNTTLIGAGLIATIVKAAASLPDVTAAPFTGLSVSMIATNSDWAGSNTGIALGDIGFDITAKGRASDHCVHMRNTSGFRAENVFTRGGGDGIALTASTNFAVSKGWATGHLNAAYDCWEGCDRGEFSDNDIVGAGATNLNGILVTGLTTLNIAATTKNITVTNNRIKNVGQGVWLQGGVVGGQTGSCIDCHVTDNTFDTIVSFHAIRASEGVGHIITANTAITVTGAGVMLLGEAAAGAATDCIVADNTFRNVGSATIAAVDLGNGAVSTNVHHNRAYGSQHQYGVACRTGATNNNVESNIADAGVTGRILPGDASNVIRNNPGFVTAKASAATIANATTSIVVNHGLSVTPNVNNISLTKQNNPTNAVTSLWVSTITSTQFTINASADPGASGLTVGWVVAP